MDKYGLKYNEVPPLSSFLLGLPQPIRYIYIYIQSWQDFNVKAEILLSFILLFDMVSHPSQSLPIQKPIVWQSDLSFWLVNIHRVRIKLKYFKQIERFYFKLFEIIQLIYFEYIHFANRLTRMSKTKGSNNNILFLMAVTTLKLVNHTYILIIQFKD